MSDTEREPSSVTFEAKSCVDSNTDFTLAPTSEREVGIQFAAAHANEEESMRCFTGDNSKKELNKDIVVGELGGSKGPTTSPTSVSEVPLDQYLSLAISLGVNSRKKLLPTNSTGLDVKSIPSEVATNQDRFPRSFEIEYDGELEVPCCTEAGHNIEVPWTMGSQREMAVTPAREVMVDDNLPRVCPFQMNYSGKSGLALVVSQDDITSSPTFTSGTPQDDITSSPTFTSDTHELDPVHPNRAKFHTPFTWSREDYTHDNCSELSPSSTTLNPTRCMTNTYVTETVNPQKGVVLSPSNDFNLLRMESQSELATKSPQYEERYTNSSNQISTRQNLWNRVKSFLSCSRGLKKDGIIYKPKTETGVSSSCRITGRIRALEEGSCCCRSTESLKCSEEEAHYNVFPKRKNSNKDFEENRKGSLESLRKEHG